MLYTALTKEVAQAKVDCYGPIYFHLARSPLVFHNVGERKGI